MDHWKKPGQITSIVLINFYFVAKEYYKFENTTPIWITPAYKLLVQLCLKNLKINFGELGIVIETVKYILHEFENENPTFKKHFFLLLHLNKKICAWISK